jgi:hypothetical protein
MPTSFPGALFARYLESHHAAASDLVGAVYDNGFDDDGFPICGVEDGALLIQTPAGSRKIAFRALGNAEIDCCTPASLALANRLRDEARVASDANWFGAYARWAGLTDGDAIDTERRNTVVARMKKRLDATMPRASDALSDRAPGFLLDLCSALYAIDHEKPFQVETVRTLARALEDSPCKVVAAKLHLAIYRAGDDKWALAEAAAVLRAANRYRELERLEGEIGPPADERDRAAAAAVLTSVAAGYLDRGSLGHAARVARKAKDYCMSDHLQNLLAAVEAERNRV